jgi:hypothetical protein
MVRYYRIGKNSVSLFAVVVSHNGSGPAVAEGLRHYAMSWKVPGLRPDEIIECYQLT